MLSLIQRSSSRVCTSRVASRSRHRRSISSAAVFNQSESNPEVFIWGRGDRGALGLGPDVIVQPTPARLSLPESGAVQLATGMNHAFVVVERQPAQALGQAQAQAVFAFGLNDDGQLGLGDTTSRFTPQRVNSAALDGRRLVRLAAGGHHTLLATTAADGSTEPRVLAFGRNEHGQLGLGEPFRDQPAVSSPTEIRSLRGERVAALACSEDGSVVATERGVVAFGRGLCPDRADDALNEPRPVPGPVGRVTSLAAGWGHVVALTADGLVWSWGSNVHGQCGHGDKERYSSPRQLRLQADVQVAAIAAGSCHTLLLTRNHQVYFCGSGHDGKGCVDERLDFPQPRRLSFFDDKRVVQIASGSDHLAVLTDDGSLYMWGYGQHATLGFPELKTLSTPRAVPSPERGRRFSVAACSMDTTIAVLA
eukprot:TRINITY_DN8581_c0_g1_i1.p1 TRINITY_DN8581_c0_g1~~TRINITY_DN8581_c0_g1_i1.p1  ORF type:complete len:422 (+),score=80.91 TRINITY_DN8581_c0_g1_i1:1155-2420(+)